MVVRQTIYRYTLKDSIQVDIDLGCHDLTVMYNKYKELDAIKLERVDTDKIFFIEEW